jgi:hypothetical protein
MKNKRFFVSVVTVAVVLGAFFFFFFFGFFKPWFRSAVLDVNRVQVAVVERAVVPQVARMRVSNVSVVVNGVAVVADGVDGNDLIVVNARHTNLSPQEFRIRAGFKAGAFLIAKQK